MFMLISLGRTFRQSLYVYKLKFLPGATGKKYLFLKGTHKASVMVSLFRVLENIMLKKLLKDIVAVSDLIHEVTVIGRL